MTDKGLGNLVEMLGMGLRNAGAEELVVSHFDGVSESLKFRFIDVIYGEKVIGADAVDYCCVRQEAQNLDGKLVLAETGSSHFLRCLIRFGGSVIM